MRSLKHKEIYRAHRVATGHRLADEGAARSASALLRVGPTIGLVMQIRLPHPLSFPFLPFPTFCFVANPVAHRSSSEESNHHRQCNLMSREAPQAHAARHPGHVAAKPKTTRRDNSEAVDARAGRQGSVMQGFPGLCQASAVASHALSAPPIKRMGGFSYLRLAAAAAAPHAR